MSSESNTQEIQDMYDAHRRTEEIAEDWYNQTEHETYTDHLQQTADENEEAAAHMREDEREYDGDMDWDGGMYDYDTE